MKVGKVVSLMHQLLLPPRKYSWFSYLLEAELTPEPYCGQKDYVNKRFQWHHWESSLRPTSYHSASTNRTILRPKQTRHSGNKTWCLLFVNVPLHTVRTARTVYSKGQPKITVFWVMNLMSCSYFSFYTHIPLTKVAYFSVTYIMSRKSV
jgi:hypothetical protein